MITKENIRNLLNESGMSREDFAKSIGTFKGTVDGWLGQKSQKEIPLPTLLLIEYLYFRKKPKFDIDLSLDELDKLRARCVAEATTPGEFIISALKQALAGPERATNIQPLPLPLPLSRVAEEPDAPPVTEVPDRTVTYNKTPAKKKQA